MSVLPKLTNRFNAVINEGFLNEWGVCGTSSGTEWVEGLELGISLLPCGRLELARVGYFKRKITRYTKRKKKTPCKDRANIRTGRVRGWILEL